MAEIRFSVSNKQHFGYDLAPLGLENDNEVFHADDRPYGLIEATVPRENAPPAGRAWDRIPGFTCSPDESKALPESGRKRQDFGNRTCRS